MPELTALGNRIEIQRKKRGIRKKELAAAMEVSRQHLWRLQTGRTTVEWDDLKSLAKALDLDFEYLVDLVLFENRPARPSAGLTEEPHPDPGNHTPFSMRSPGVREFIEYVADLVAVERTIGTLPSGEIGRKLKNGLFDEIELLARGFKIPLLDEYWVLRQRVHEGDL
jgi:transcriptional regulator with XRE-family HTH domain